MIAVGVSVLLRIETIKNGKCFVVRYWNIVGARSLRDK